MIYIMGTWAHVRDLTKRLGLQRRRDFLHYKLPQDLAGTHEPNVVVLVTAYENRGVYQLFQEINARKATTWGEQDLIDGKVPR